MVAFFDGAQRPGARRAMNIADELASRNTGTMGTLLQPVIFETTKLILGALEREVRSGKTTEEAWVQIMMDQEKQLGSASPRGCYEIATSLDLNHQNALWQSPTDENDKLYLVKNMVNQLLDESRRSEEWELRYPVTKQKNWIEGEQRTPRIRLVIGQSPQLFFADVPHNELMRQALNNTVFLRGLCEEEIPPQLKNSCKPVSQWFAETPGSTPHMALWLSDGDQSNFELSDPRMHFIKLRVHNSVNRNEPVLPFQLSGVFAHALMDGEPAKLLMQQTWKAALADQPDQGIRHAEQGRIAQLPPTNQQAERVRPPNPFREIGFKYSGCKEFANAVGFDQVTERLTLADQELAALLKAAKLLGCKSNSLFMMGVLGVSGTAPVSSVATKEQWFKDKKGKTRKKRIQMAAFGNKLFYDSPQFKALANWAKNPTEGTTLDALLENKLFKDFPRQLTADLLKHLALYESQIALAQTHNLGILTYNAAVAGQRRQLLENLVGELSPHMAAIARPQIQFSTLGAAPAVGEGALHWEFESACSETVVNTIALIGNELSCKQFLDNPIALFDVWQLFLQQNKFLPVELLRETFTNGLYSNKLIDWLNQLAESRGDRFRKKNVIASAPIEVAGVQFDSIHAALAEAGRNSKIMAELVSFFNELLGLTAQWAKNSPNRHSFASDFETLIHAKAYQTLCQTVIMTEAVAHALLIQNGFAEETESFVLGGACNYHKHRSISLNTALAPPLPSAQI